MRVAESGFFGSVEKAILRTKFNLPLMRSFANELSTKLAYLGLPGPEIEDLLAWREVIVESTGVERLRRGATRVQDLEIHRRLHSKVLTNGISNFQLLRGNIEDVLLDGYDIDKKAPRRSYEDGTERRFAYDLVNLDFFGGVGYARNNGPAKRVAAIKKLLTRQQQHDFLLLLTINVRDDLIIEMQNFINSLSERCRPTESVLLKRHLTNAEGEKHLLLKAVVPAFIRSSAEENLLSCLSYPPVAYTGTNAYMIHFAFQLRAIRDVSFQAFSSQTLEQILQLPLLRATQEGIIVSGSEQVMGWDATSLKAFEWLNVTEVV